MLPLATYSLDGRNDGAVVSFSKRTVFRLPAQVHTANRINWLKGFDDFYGKQPKVGDMVNFKLDDAERVIEIKRAYSDNRIRVDGGIKVRDWALSLYMNECVGRVWKDFPRGREVGSSISNIMVPSG